MQNDKYFIEINNGKINYSIVKTKRKTIGITVDRNGKVKVSAPLYVSEKEIREVVQEKTDWIAKKVNEVRKRNLNTVHKEFVSGEEFFYLGEKYTLKIAELDLAKPEVLMQADTIVVYIFKGLTGESRKQVVKETLIKWYRQCFTEVAEERIEKYSLHLNVSPRKVVVKDQKPDGGVAVKRETLI